MTTPDYPDWTQPVSQIEQVSGNLLPAGLTAQAPATVLDTRGFASLVLAVPLHTGSPGFLYRLGVTWIEQGQVVASSDVTFSEHDDYTDGTSQINTQIPVRASSVQLALQSSGAAPTLPISAFGSSRIVADQSIGRVAVWQGPQLADTGIQTVPANGSVTPAILAPGAKALSVFMPNVTVGLGWQLDAITSLPGGLQWVPFANGQAASGGSTSFPVPVARRTTRLSLTNITASAHSSRAVVWDAS